MSPRPVQVLVVDDSPLCVDVLASRIARDPRLAVAGVAYDGLRAVELASRLRPAVITMDLQMPRLDGLAAIERIMREHPTRILVVTSRDERGSLAFEALRRGACDLLEKPGAHEDHEALCQRIWALAGAPHPSRPRPVAPRALAARALAARARPPRPLAPRAAAVIGLVASTGGPSALATICRALPADLGAALLVVQHLPAGFVERLARWLDGVSPLTVAVAADGDRLLPGRVLLAPDDRHLVVETAGRARLVLGPPVDGHRPSGTRLLESLARSYGPEAAGLVLTGMGRDGAEGLSALERAGARTAVQDEATSTVSGMPRAALEASAASVALPLGVVAPHIVALARGAELS
jgi:two-component system, chemotaxis family, protein-glutamate methylesterase/glutaminase